MTQKIDLSGLNKAMSFMLEAFQSIEIGNYGKAENIARMLEQASWKDCQARIYKRIGQITEAESSNC